MQIKAAPQKYQNQEVATVKLTQVKGIVSIQECFKM